MRFFEHTSIKRKQMLIIMLTTSIALLLACAAFVGYEVFTFHKGMVQNLTTLAGIAGDNTSAALNFNDADSARETLGALRAEPNLVGAAVYTRDGSIFATYERPDVAGSFKPPALSGSAGHVHGGGRLSLFCPIEMKGETVGTIYLESDMGALHSLLRHYAAIVAAVFSVTLLVAFLISSRLQHVVSEPILHLVQTARTVARGRDYSVRVARRTQDEIGVLIDGFNEMLAQIQERDGNLQRASTQLELRVVERTRELASSLSLVHATIESTADGILVVDRSGAVTTSNEKFRAMWGIPGTIPGKRVEMLEFTLEKLKDAARFQARVEELNAHAEKEDADLLELNDGRIFEYYSKPQQVGERFVGRVWSFRDITERKQVEEALRESQALYHSLVEQLPVGIFRKDREGRFVFVNSSYCHLKSMEAGQFIGKTAQEFADVLKTDRDVPAIEVEFTKRGADHHEQIMKTGRQIEYEEHYPHRGTYLHVVKSPVSGPDGTVIGSQGILVDITARKLAEAELARERDLLTILLENSPDYIYFKDVNSRFLRCSRALSERFGLRPEELVGKSDADLYTEEHARPALEDEQKIMSTGNPIIGKIEKEVWKQGEIMWVLTSKIPLRNQHGEIIGTFGLTKDITAIKDAENRLEQVHKQLLETSRMAGMAEVATSVLHNVGNVLNSVNVSCSVVSDKLRNSRLTNVSKVAALLQACESDLPGFFARDPKGKQLPGYLNSLAGHLAGEQQDMLKELVHLSTNIDHIKEIVAMQQSYSKVSGVRESLSADELVEDALRMNGAAMERHQIKVVREYSKTPLVQVERHKVLQILINILRNAKYACDDSGRTDKQVTLRVGLNGNQMVKIAVIDNGVGITAENLTRIFEHGFTTRKSGHGFGLHSGALAARELGGALAAHSDGPGKGAVFTLELPCQTTEQKL